MKLSALGGFADNSLTVPFGQHISYPEGMDHSEFKIGLEFFTAAGTWRCTDIGTRVITAIRIDRVERVTSTSEGEQWTDHLTREQAESEGWFDGPPYAIAESVFDEFDQEGCSLDPHEWDDDKPAAASI